MGELQRLLHDPVFHRLGLTLVHFLWQGLALALLALLLRALLRRAAPALRYLVLLGLFVTMAAAPVLTFTLWTKAPPPAAMTVLEMQRALAIETREPSPSPPPPGPRAQAPTRPPVLIRAEEWLRALWWWRVRRRLPVAGLLWMAGVLALSLRLLLQWGLFVRVARRARPLAEEQWQRLLASLCVRLEVRRAVRLLQSVEVGMPTAAGWLRPVILLPPAVLLGLTPEQLEAVLAHELAHIRRHDFLVNVFQRVVEVLLFYHPAVWWVSGLIRLERELCCDDLAVRAGCDRVTYARALEELESRRGSAPPPTLSVARGPVLARVARLLLPVEEGRRPLSWSTVLFPTLALTAIALISSIAPVGGRPYIVGTLIYADSQPWEDLVAHAISGRTEWRLKGTSPYGIQGYSPRGDAVLCERDNGYVPREGDNMPNANDIWEVPLDSRGHPDLAHAENLIARAGLSRAAHGFALWSPDGRRILFKRSSVPDYRAWAQRIWVMNADGSDAHPIPVPPGSCRTWGGLWAPDGSRVVLHGWATKPRRPGYETFLVDLDGKDFRALRATDGTISPDGRWIVGVRRLHEEEMPEREDGTCYWLHPATAQFDWELVLLRADGTDERRLLYRSEPATDFPAGPDTIGPVVPGGLAWSPDSGQIAFLSAMNRGHKGPTTGEEVELFIYDLPSGRHTQMTHDNIEQRTPVWIE
jgi:beta-lactamase regulating signal transducer with metallopeptidase domain